MKLDSSIRHTTTLSRIKVSGSVSQIPHFDLTVFPPVDRHCGPRILTFFLYLSDVEAGGGTDFPQLDITVEPKKGRALLWPSVLDSSPMSKDNRMFHQALKVEDGTKFAANGWIHMFDYTTPQKTGCN